MEFEVAQTHVTMKIAEIACKCNHFIFGYNVCACNARKKEKNCKKWTKEKNDILAIKKYFAEHELNLRKNEIAHRNEIN